jgi:ferredoxin--NADP+ reductase
VIGTNKADAISTVAAMVEDLPQLRGARDQYRTLEAAEALVRSRKRNYVSRQGWKKLDAYEAACGAAQGRPRIKVASVEEMLAIIDA